VRVNPAPVELLPYRFPTNENPSHQMDACNFEQDATVSSAVCLWQPKQTKVAHRLCELSLKLLLAKALHGDLTLEERLLVQYAERLMREQKFFEMLASCGPVRCRPYRDTALFGLTLFHMVVDERRLRAAEVMHRVGRFDRSFINAGRMDMDPLGRMYSFHGILDDDDDMNNWRRL
jgi:hypothetical protein